MRILHVIPSLSPDLGGPPQVAMNLVHALRNLSVDAEIATTDFGLDVPVNQRLDYVFDHDHNLSVPTYFLQHNRPALKEFIFSKALTGWLWKHLPDYDVIDNHYLFSYAPTCAAAIARHKQVPYTMRTMGQLTPCALEQSRKKKEIYSLLIERRNLNRAAAIHCTAKDEALDVAAFGIQTPTATLPLGVHAPTRIANAKQELREQYNLSNETAILLFLSRLHYKKRPDLLLKSAARLKSQGKVCHVILAGSGENEYVIELKQLAQDLGIGAQVSFPGFVNGRDKDLLLQGSDVFVLPSFSENFGIAIAEALAAELPVVITPGIQIAPEIDAAHAGLVVTGEVAPLSEAMTMLIDMPEVAAQIRKNGLLLVQQRYSWQAIAQQLTPIYKEIQINQRLLTSRQPIEMIQPKLSIELTGQSS